MARDEKSQVRLKTAPFKVLIKTFDELNEAFWAEWFRGKTYGNSLRRKPEDQKLSVNVDYPLRMHRNKQRGGRPHN